jgi:ribose transport system ATP-binding protein
LHEIYARLKLNADRGGSVIVGSTEYEDLARLCDRVLVFHDGVISTELRGDSLTPSRLLERVFGRPIAEIAEERERDEDVT